MTSRVCDNSFGKMFIWEGFKKNNTEVLDYTLYERSKKSKMNDDRSLRLDEMKESCTDQELVCTRKTSPKPYFRMSALGKMSESRKVKGNKYADNIQVTTRESASRLSCWPSDIWLKFEVHF